MKKTVLLLACIVCICPATVFAGKPVRESLPTPTIYSAKVDSSSIPYQAQLNGENMLGSDQSAFSISIGGIPVGTFSLLSDNQIDFEIPAAIADQGTYLVSLQNIGGKVSFELAIVSVSSDISCYPGNKAACYTGPSGTEEVGVCKAGIRSCSTSGLWGDCIGQITPAEEICDGFDNNCDGQIDEGCGGQIGTPCSDGNGCTTNDVWQMIGGNVVCMGEGVSCSDGLAYTTDSCESTGTSTYRCIHTLPDCSYLNDQCNEGVFNTSTHICEVSVKVGISCIDNDICTMNETCQPNGDCVGTWDTASCGCTTASDCEDGLLCTTDICNAANSCQYSIIFGCTEP